MLVIGCIEANFCKKICVWQRFSSSIRFAFMRLWEKRTEIEHFCTAPNSNISHTSWEPIRHATILNSVDKSKTLATCVVNNVWSYCEVWTTFVTSFLPTFDKDWQFLNKLGNIWQALTALMSTTKFDNFDNIPVWSTWHRTHCLYLRSDKFIPMRGRKRLEGADRGPNADPDGRADSRADSGADGFWTRFCFYMIRIPNHGDVTMSEYYRQNLKIRRARSGLYRSRILEVDASFSAFF